MASDVKPRIIRDGVRWAPEAEVDVARARIAELEEALAVCGRAGCVAASELVAISPAPTEDRSGREEHTPECASRRWATYGNAHTVHMQPLPCDCDYWARVTATPSQSPCTCAAIQAADPSRHFKGCARRVEKPGYRCKTCGKSYDETGWSPEFCSRGCDPDPYGEAQPEPAPEGDKSQDDAIDEWHRIQPRRADGGLVPLHEWLGIKRDALLSGEASPPTDAKAEAPDGIYQVYGDDDHGGHEWSEAAVVTLRAKRDG